MGSPRALDFSVFIQDQASSPLHLCLWHPATPTPSLLPLPPFYQVWMSPSPRSPLQSTSCTRQITSPFLLHITHCTFFLSPLLLWMNVFLFLIFRLVENRSYVLFHILFALEHRAQCLRHDHCSISICWINEWKSLFTDSQVSGVSWLQRPRPRESWGRIFLITF